jgi:hypothetical protein
MAEALFGTVSPMWSTLPFPMPAPSPAIGTSPTGVMPAGIAAPIAPSFGPETGVTAPALVMAVALRRGQPAGPASDQEIEEFVYDALDLLPGTSDLEVRSDAGRITLTGNVSQKRLKRDAGEIAWAIPGINDVHNTITIAPRLRARMQGREGEPATVPARKPA